MIIHVQCFISFAVLFFIISFILILMSVLICYLPVYRKLYKTRVELFTVGGLVINELAQYCLLFLLI